ncbi:hypothetical protein A6A04_01260 [Paramagnetospirillum marisnigri]|uniref:TIGR02302 family protein n=1 Tax=Paramagnetospirillum marisnigri TaxID=1285242 RepID=A0A178MSI6_9PROT|nr:DUF4175 family protein [Paramagnetospirillum marisnigri]OAN52350.1 hypothetical protein A6A04_01260 [Paramagnetospirillum marisnigri]
MTALSLADRLHLARLALWWERLVPAVTAGASLLALATALALFDAASWLPGWLHALVLLALLAALVWLVWWARRQVPPTEAEAQRRLEAESGVSHRPLAVLEDRLASGDAPLWRLHLQRMEAEAETLRPGWPRPVLAARDPFALRFAALLLLVIALAGTGADWPQRLGRFLIPAMALPGLGPVAVEAWVQPPPETGLGPMALPPDGRAVSIPRGSTVTAVLRGGLGRGSLRAGDAEVAFGADDGGGRRAEAVVESGERLVVEQGWRTVAAWPLAVVADAPPVVSLSNKTESDERGRLNLRLDASDDYGLARLWLAIRPVEPPPGTETLTLPLVLPGDRPRQAALAPRLDLAAHDWAGLPVLVAPHAEDGAGQIGLGLPLRLTLPERLFRNPVARALIEWRRQVSQSPQAAPEVVLRLRLLLADPDAVNGDGRVYLALSLVRRLLASPGFDRHEVRDLLWNAATRLDEGGLPAAEQELEQARRDLEQALAEGAPPAKLAELLERFEAALERWMAAMAEGPAGPSAPGDAQVVDEADLMEAMEALRQLAETGDREGLRRRLAELGETLSQLGRARPPGPEDQAAAKALSRLRDLARQQQDLLDHSFQRAPRPQEDFDEESDPLPSAKPSAAQRAEARKAAEAQKRLAEALAQLGRDLGQPPPALGDAGRAMSEAAESLGRADWAGAAEKQGEALRLLQDGGRDLAEAMAAARSSRGGAAMDPLGRGGPGKRLGDDGGTRVQGGSDGRRAREILEELRRRASDPRRPEVELDYLRRLLRQF